MNLDLGSDLLMILSTVDPGDGVDLLQENRSRLVIDEVGAPRDVERSDVGGVSTSAPSRTRC